MVVPGTMNEISRQENSPTVRGSIIEFNGDHVQVTN